MKYLFILALALSTTHLSAKAAKVVAISGSTRVDSLNKQLINHAAEVAREMGSTVTVIDFKEYAMPFYDGDLETKEGMPANAKRMKSAMLASDVIIIATPDYNKSIPGVLKNALDWVSRTEDGKRDRDVFKGKKFIITGTGGSATLDQLRVIIESLHGEIVGKPTQLKHELKDPAKIKQKFQSEFRALKI